MGQTNTSNSSCTCIENKNPKQRKIEEAENLEIFIIFKISTYTFDEFIGFIQINGGQKLSIDQWSIITKEYILDSKIENSSINILLNLLIPEYLGTKSSYLDIMLFIFTFTKHSENKVDFLYNLIINTIPKFTIKSLRIIVTKLLVYNITTIPLIINSFLYNSKKSITELNIDEIKESMIEALTLFNNDSVEKIENEIYFFFYDLKDKNILVDKNSFNEFYEREGNYLLSQYSRRKLISNYFENPKMFIDNLGKRE